MEWDREGEAMKIRMLVTTTWKGRTYRAGVVYTIADASVARSWIASGKATDYNGVSPAPSAILTHFVHTQSAASSTWTIAHNMGRYPSVTIVDAQGNVIQAEIAYLTTTSVRITFSEPVAGSAYLN
jgi:hypothetical protein